MLNVKMIIFSTLLLFIFMCGCGKKKELPSAIRAIKTITVSDSARGQTRNLSGVVHAVNNSQLSFEDVEGRVEKVNVDIGGSVRKGDVLAVLDSEKYKLDLVNAQANMKKAEANLVKSQVDFNRAKDLFSKNVISKQDYESKTFLLAAAESEIKSQKANLGQSERNLKNTKLLAPFDGSIGARNIEPQQSVRAGESIFRLDAKGKKEVQFDIPEGLHKLVKTGTDGSVTFSSIPGESIDCQITFLGTAAGRGNAFPAKALLLEENNEIRPGMSAEVSLRMPVSSTTSGFLLPTSAFLITKEPKTAFIFVYDRASSTVRKVKVKTRGAEDNLGIADGSIKEGDIIAVAGISFLYDGMKVKLYQPKNAKSGKTGE